MSVGNRRRIAGVISAVTGLVFLGGCGLQPPTHPTPPPSEPVALGPKPNVAGVWRGEVTVADCWRVQGEGPDPCDVRRGKTEPVVLDIAHIAPPVLDVDLRVTVTAFMPAAQGTCYGTRDASGAVFFQGLIRRSSDQLDVLVTFRGQLDGDRIASLEETVDMNVTMRNSAGSQILGERWTFSSIRRQ
jgi:hypothetical protein